MNASAAYSSESLIGPPSQPIVPREFIQRATLGFEIPDELHHHMEEECGVADLKELLEQTLTNPFQYSYIVQNHTDTIESIRAANKPGTNKPKKRKRTDATAPDESQLNPEVKHLRDELNNIALSSWKYPTDAAFFTRPQKNSDLNTLTEAKSHGSFKASSSSELGLEEEAVIIVSVYNRLSWGNHLSRSSQHAVLASQTVGDLYEIIPCPSNELPLETLENGEAVGYSANAVAPHCGAVVCIEGIALGDGQSEDDYSDKLIRQLDSMPKNKRPNITKGMSMHDQRFVDLTLRLNHAYWLLHQGTCEHFLVVDHIRMLHVDDPQDGYPYTLHIAPPILDLCMACSRVPAVLSIVGDIRLGQSPYKICSPCWNQFGEPDEQEKVMVVPLPKYEHGW